MASFFMASVDCLLVRHLILVLPSFPFAKLPPPLSPAFVQTSDSNYLF